MISLGKTFYFWLIKMRWPSRFENWTVFSLAWIIPQTWVVSWYFRYIWVDIVLIKNSIVFTLRGRLQLRCINLWVNFIPQIWITSCCPVLLANVLSFCSLFIFTHLRMSKVFLVVRTSWSVCFWSFWIWSILFAFRSRICPLLKISLDDVLRHLTRNILLNSWV